MVKDIRPALRAFLLADASIAAVVGTRIYPIKIPQGVAAASLVYTKVSARPDHHMSGASGLARPRLQLDAWAPTADAALWLADLVRERLDGYSGTMGSGGAAVTVQGVFFADEREDFDDAANLFRMSRDYFINYEES